MELGGALVVVNESNKEERLPLSATADLQYTEHWLQTASSATPGTRVLRVYDVASATIETKGQKVERVLYPGLPDHPGHELQKRQAGGFGALISFDLGSHQAAKTFLDRLEVLTLAESLGGVETLISQPSTMTHASVPADKRAELGITDGLVRVSVGLEDVEDLIADLDRALAAV